MTLQVSGSAPCVLESDATSDGTSSVEVREGRFVRQLIEAGRQPDARLLRLRALRPSPAHSCCLAESQSSTIQYLPPKSSQWNRRGGGHGACACVMRRFLPCRVCACSIAMATSNLQKKLAWFAREKHRVFPFATCRGGGFCLNLTVLVGDLILAQSARLGWPASGCLSQYQYRRRGALIPTLIMRLGALGESRAFLLRKQEVAAPGNHNRCRALGARNGQSACLNSQLGHHRARALVILRWHRGPLTLIITHYDTTPLSFRLSRLRRTKRPRMFLRLARSWVPPTHGRKIHQESSSYISAKSGEADGMGGVRDWGGDDLTKAGQRKFRRTHHRSCLFGVSLYVLDLANVVTVAKATPRRPVSDAKIGHGHNQTISKSVPMGMSIDLLQPRKQQTPNPRANVMGGLSGGQAIQKTHCGAVRGISCPTRQARCLLLDGRVGIPYGPDDVVEFHAERAVRRRRTGRQPHSFVPGYPGVIMQRSSTDTGP